MNVSYVSKCGVTAANPFHPSPILRPCFEPTRVEHFIGGLHFKGLQTAGVLLLLVIFTGLDKHTNFLRNSYIKSP